MEKIKVNSQTFNLVPNGISSINKQRSFTITSSLTYTEIESAFSDVSRIEYLSEIDEVLNTYLDGVSLKSLSKDIDSGTYMAVIGVDAIERYMNTITSAQTNSELALVEVYELILGVMY